MKKNKGITLVALVVTIIVLLILAGVSLSLVAGSDGILSKAGKAVDKNKIATAKEIAELVIMDVQADYYEDAYVDESYGESKRDYIIKKLQLGIKNSDYLIQAEENGNIKVYKRDTLETLASGNLNENGKMQWDDEIKQEMPNMLATQVISTSNYGDKVNYEANGVTEWEIFLNDGANLYLIAKDYVPVNGMKMTEGISTDGNYNIYGNSQSTLINWLTNTTNWSQYAEGFSGAMAMGGPTKEQFCDSYNAKYGTSHSKGLDSNSKFTVTNPVAPYVISNPSIVHGYWLASAETDPGSNVWRANYTGSISADYYSNPYNGIRPLIQLPADVYARKSGNIWILSKNN